MSGTRGLDLLDELLRRDLLADEDQRVDVPSLFQCSMKLSSCASAAVVSEPADRQRRVGAPLHAEVAQRGHDDRLHPGAVGRDVDDGHLLAGERAFSFSSAMITRSRRSEVMSG